MIEIYAINNDPKKGHETGQKLLKAIFRSKYPSDPIPPVVKGQNGKPRFENSGYFEFNLSHSGIWTVLAVSCYPVGIDVQEIREIRPQVIRRFYTERENVWLSSLPDERKTEAAIRVWSIKEAVTKAEGGALSVRIRDIQTIDYDNTQKRRVNGFYVSSPDFKDAGYILSVASEKENEAEIVYLQQ